MAARAGARQVTARPTQRSFQPLYTVREWPRHDLAQIPFSQCLLDRPRTPTQHHSPGPRSAHGERTPGPCCSSGLRASGSKSTTMGKGSRALTELMLTIAPSPWVSKMGCRAPTIAGCRRCHLFLVAQPGARWGCCHGQNGKMIWSEQLIEDPSGPGRFLSPAVTSALSSGPKGRTPPLPAADHCRNLRLRRATRSRSGDDGRVLT